MMPPIIAAHPAVFAVAAYWVFSSLVGGMPVPTPASGPGYVWAYNSLHLLAGNVTAAISSKYPQLANLPAGTVQVTTTQEKTVTATPPPTPSTETKS